MEKLSASACTRTHTLVIEGRMPSCKEDTLIGINFEEARSMKREEHNMWTTITQLAVGGVNVTEGDMNSVAFYYTVTFIHACGKFIYHTKKSSTYICQPNQLTLFSCTEIKFNVHFIGSQILRQKGILTRQRKLSMSTWYMFPK